MKRAARGLLLALAAASALDVRVASQTRLIVSAASSLTDVLMALEPEAERQTGARILFNFGGSGSLRKQIEEGAPVDIFFSASSTDMDRLENAGLIVPGTRCDILSNAMVLIGDKAGPRPSDAKSLRLLFASNSLLAIGNPDTVPAGRYAMELFASLGLLSAVEKKLVLGGSVREVLQFVESGSAPYGVVFQSDAQALKSDSSVAMLYHFPDDALSSPIRYPVAVIAASSMKDVARRLIQFLSGAEARAFFVQAGFGIE